MSTQPFAPQGNTVAITSAATSTAAVQVSGASNTVNYEIQVVGAVPMYFAWGSSSANAPAAVIPVNGTPANGYPVQPGQAKTISAPPGAWFTTIATATTSTALITPGDGM